MCSNKINQAIRDCLDSCYESEAPLMALVVFAEKLAADRDWTHEELVQVTKHVFPILFRMVDKP